MLRSRSLPLLSALLLLAACDSETATSGGGTGADDQGGGGQAVGPASLHFFVDERPHDPANEEHESDEGRFSDPVRIVARSLGPKRKVRLETSLGSWAVFEADQDGTVDLGRDAPLEGSWDSVDVDGPIWSGPNATSTAHDYEVWLTDAATEESLASGTFHRLTVDVGVETTVISEGTRVGTLARPAVPAARSRPAVLVFGGSEGGASSGTYFARYLAQLGYTSFGVGYFGAPGLPMDLERVPLEILEEDLAFLASQPDVDPTRIAVMGGSRGGELALMLGARFPDRVRAVIAQVPSGYVWGAASGGGGPAWTYGGEDIPFVPSAGAFPESYFEDGEQFFIFSPTFLASIEAASPDELALATTRAELIGGPVLLLAGEDDNLWPSCALADVAWQRLAASGHVATHGDEAHCFPSAGHFIAFPPGTSTLSSTAYHNAQYDIWIDVGGTPRGNAAAKRAGDSATRAFLERALGEGGP